MPSIEVDERRRLWQPVRPRTRPAGVGHVQFAWNQFGHAARSWALGVDRNFVHQHLRFDDNAARLTRTAAEDLRERTGVRRDRTHLTRRRAARR
jgi:hypothetical protein